MAQKNRLSPEVVANLAELRDRRVPTQIPARHIAAYYGLTKHQAARYLNRAPQSPEVSKAAEAADFRVFIEADRESRTYKKAYRRLLQTYTDSPSGPAPAGRTGKAFFSMVAEATWPDDERDAREMWRRVSLVCEMVVAVQQGWGTVDDQRKKGARFPQRSGYGQGKQDEPGWAQQEVEDLPQATMAEVVAEGVTMSQCLAWIRAANNQKDQEELVVPSRRVFRLGLVETNHKKRRALLEQLLPHTLPDTPELLREYERPGRAPRGGPAQKPFPTLAGLQAKWAELESQWS